MSPTDILVVLLFALLAMATLAIARLLRVMLLVRHGGVNLALLAPVVTCGVFALQPDLTAQRLRDLLPSAPNWSPSLRWLVTGPLVVAGLPVMVRLQHARELALHGHFLRLWHLPHFQLRLRQCRAGQTFV